MTLAELAALAESRVPGFIRPMYERIVCEEVNHCSADCNAEPGPNDSPAALLMAVMLYARKHHGDVEMNGASVAIVAVQIGPGLKPALRRGRAAMPEETEESIARAALVALLRAHGVEVQDAE